MKYSKSTSLVLGILLTLVLLMPNSVYGVLSKDDLSQEGYYPLVEASICQECIRLGIDLNRLEVTDIPCTNCKSGFLAKYFIGEGDWRMTDAILCRQHTACSLIQDEKTMVYEYLCSNHCSFYEYHFIPEYRYIHRM